MGKISIMGLGTGKMDEMSVKSFKLLNDDISKFSRTSRHPVFNENSFDNLVQFDSIFEEKENIEDVYIEIEKILKTEMDKKGHILYIVPGSPYNSDVIIERLMSNDKIETEIIDNMSFLDKAVKMASFEGNIKIMKGNDENHDFDIHAGNIVCNIESLSMATKIKLEMTEVYPPDCKIKLFDVLANKNDEISLFELDRQRNYDYSTYIFIESIEKSTLGLYNIIDLKKTMSYLRGSEGCPWDRKQTHMSLRECVIEEAYEVVDAIEKDDIENMVEELGDLLLQVVFHSQIADEEGYFNFEDVTKHICEKLIRRHPHVFKDKVAIDEEEVLQTWEEIKNLEKQVESYTGKLQKIPKAMSPLSRGYKIQKVAAEIGFDWPDISGAIDKVKEELQELMEAYESMEKDKIEEELGDLFFSLINFSRFLKINPDIALSRTNTKFIKRFGFIEKNAEKDLKQMTLEEMDTLWETSKRH